MLNIKYQKVGGIRFLRIGCFQFSVCVTTKKQDIRKPIMSDYALGCMLLAFVFYMIATLSEGVI